MGGEQIVVGVDEVGRGALFGPIFAAAVAYKKNNIPHGVKDSKKLSAKQREKYFKLIEETAEEISVSFISNFDIDQINIQKANIECLRNAVLNLKKEFDIVYVDGYRINNLPYKQKVVIKGDEKIPVISAASIVAKVLRDRLIIDFSKYFPPFGLNKNKGYATKEHKEAIKRYGLTIFHRKSFKIKN